MSISCNQVATSKTACIEVDRPPRSDQYLSSMASRVQMLPRTWMDDEWMMGCYGPNYPCIVYHQQPPPIVVEPLDC